MIEIDPDICAGCQRCCHGTPGNYIPVQFHNDKTPRINKHHRCENLNRRNVCGLGPRKPLKCSIYPMVIFADGIYVDMSCPAWKEAVRQWTERFGDSVEKFDSVKEHKFVALYLARMIKDDKCSLK